MKIFEYPQDEKILRKKSLPIDRIDRSIRNTIKAMKRTVLEQPAAGLAAPQVGIHKRIIIVRLGMKDAGEYELSKPLVILNPKIIDSGPLVRGYDGCLSIPFLYGYTYRPKYLDLEGLNEFGNPFRRHFENLDARVVHHEIDHLDGILFPDRIVDTEKDLFVIVRDKAGESYLVPYKAASNSASLDKLGSQLSARLVDQIRFG